MDWSWCSLGHWEGLQAGTLVDGGMESGPGNRVEERNWFSCGSLLQLIPGAQRALGQDTRVGLALDVRGVRLLGGEGDQLVGRESLLLLVFGKDLGFRVLFAFQICEHLSLHLFS